MPERAGMDGAKATIGKGVTFPGAWHGGMLAPLVAKDEAKA